MSCAVIVFADIVGYSTRTQRDQKTLVEAMTQVAKAEVGTLMSAWEPGVVMLPTGDGLAVAFLDGAGDWRQRVGRSLRLAARLMLRMRDMGGRLRLGIHAGEVGKVDDVNSQRNVFGSAINMAQRVMDAANEDQCLISDSTWDPCIGGDAETGAWFAISRTGEVVSEPQPVQALVGNDLHTVMIKHGRHAAVRVVGLQWEDRRLTVPTPPRSKDQTILEFTPLPKNGAQFRETIGAARQIALLQLTGADMLQRLDAGAAWGGLDAFWVFMPSAEVIAQMAGRLPAGGGEPQDALIDQWRDRLTRLKVAHPLADVHLGVLDVLPFFGASMLDWDGLSGRLHISPFIWDVAPADTPGFDIAWSHGRQPSVAGPYIGAIKNLRDGTANLLGA